MATTQARVLNLSRLRNVYCAAVLAANTLMRGVEVKHVRRKDVDLEKVWELESATREGGVLYVRHYKNETSKRKIPLNGAARDAITLNTINAPGPGPGPVQARRPFPAFGEILEASDFVDASYHALQLSAERRLTDGLL